MIRGLRCALSALFLVSAAGTVAADLNVSVAISFKEAAVRLAEELTNDRGDPIFWNSGGSGILAQQVRRGAPVDLLITAGGLEMDRLERAGYLEPGTRVPLAGNRLWIVVRRGTLPPSNLDELHGDRFDRIAVANPRTAPLGRYTEQALRDLGLFERLEGRRIFAENARQTLEYVARGDADVGVVYRTDLGLVEGRVTAVDLIPESAQPAIVYEGAVIRATKQKTAALALLSRLASVEAGTLLRQWGWDPAP